MGEKKKRRRKVSERDKDTQFGASPDFSPPRISLPLSTGHSFFLFFLSFGKAVSESHTLSQPHLHLENLPWEQMHRWEGGGDRNRERNEDREKNRHSGSDGCCPHKHWCLFLQGKKIKKKYSQEDSLNRLN